MLTPGRGVVVDVHAARCLLPGGAPDPRRISNQAATPLRARQRGRWRGPQRARGRRALSPGDRVAAFCMLGGFAETAVAPEFLTFPLPGDLDFAQGASLILNYHTAMFALKLRGRLAEGETVLVHGAAGGVGTARLQIAKGLGRARSPWYPPTRRSGLPGRPGPTRRLRSDGPWKDEAKELGGVDVVIDPVGGDRFTDSLRSPARERPLRGGRLHGRLDPGGQGQPPPAQQHRGGRRRLGRVRDGQAGGQRRHRRRGGRPRSTAASCGRWWAPVTRSSARPKRSS